MPFECAVSLLFLFFLFLFPFDYSATDSPAGTVRIPCNTSDGNKRLRPFIHTHIFGFSLSDEGEFCFFFFFYYIPNGLRLLFTGEILPKEKKKKLLLPVTASQRYRTPQHILAERFTVKKARRFMYIISGEEENNDSKNEDWQLSAQMQYKCFMCAHTKKKS